MLSHPALPLAHPLLASRISLPHTSHIHYALFTPSLTPHNHPSPHSAIEHARRLLLSRNSSPRILDSCLPSILISESPKLYVFHVLDHPHPTSPLSDLHFDSLDRIEYASFSPTEVYTSSGCIPASSSATRFPNPDTSLLFSHFIDAVRVRLIDDIVNASLKDPPSSTQQQVARFKDGFLMSQTQLSTEWGASWVHKAITRPLVFCHLQIQLSSSPVESTTHLTIHPTLLPTPFLNLSHSLPLPSGTPIALLPLGTPAYFLSCYTGPTSGLNKQFSESLQGLGAGKWDLDAPSSSTRDGTAHPPQFIIGWIKVENKQGEDKGIIFIYPARLCLCYLPSASPARQPLDYIPELPAQLQPSPQMPPAVPSASVSLLAQVEATQLQDHPSSDVTRPKTPTNQQCPSYPQRPPLVHSPTSDSLRAFRSLTLSKSKDIRRVASEVGGYVDSVARERERERERLKREREGLASSPKLARASATTPASASAPTPASIGTPPLHLPSTVQPPQQGVLQPQPQQQHASSQNFYPSPPQTNLSAISIPQSSDGKTSPAGISASVHPEDDTVSAGTLPKASSSIEPLPPSPSSVPSYDPFGNIDPAWSNSSQSYLGMDVDLDFGLDLGMGFGMDLGETNAVTGPVGGSSAGAGTGGTSGDSYGYRGSTTMDFDDVAFTDDDFSFFDAPSRAVVNTESSPPQSGLPQTPSQALGMSAPLFGDNHLSDVPGPPQQTPTSATWTPGPFLEGFSSSHDGFVPLQRLPPSPGQTPRTTPQSMSGTTNVRLETNSAAIRRSSSNSSSDRRHSSGGLFEPIPFASYHRAADGKYANGKFAFFLPSPPDEEDRTEPLYLSKSPISPDFGMNVRGWKSKYNAVTDPRISVVRRLVGVKRKAPNELPRKDNAKSSAWLSEHEEWHSASVTIDDQGDDAKSDSEDEDEDNIEDDDMDNVMVSRPTTPPPKYLPLGPTLLHTQFNHSQLLPLSTSLRPPGAAVAPTNITAAVAVPSVPTPVSPAAMMGAASGKLKSLEAVASAVATEVVENPLWAETWKTNASATKLSHEVWSADIKAVAKLLESVPNVESPINIATLFGLDSNTKSVNGQEAPMINVGKGDTVIQVMPTALRFWEKLGLGPRGGRKNVTAYALFEDEGGQRQFQVEGWLSSLAACYQGKYFGDFKLGSSSPGEKDGLIPLRMDNSFRRSLASFISSIPTPNTVLVLFIILPVTSMSLASPFLRHLLSAIKKAVKTFQEGRLVVELIPEQYLLGSMEQISACDPHVEKLCSSLYNRILVPVDRVIAHRDVLPPLPIRHYFQEPAFTLARPMYPKVSYVRAAHSSLDVIDRHTLLHVGYCISRCGKWILAACIDQRGEAYKVGVWLTQTPSDQDGDAEISEETYVAKKVWDFAMQFAKKADVEWRLIVAKMGAMSEAELAAWMTHLSNIDRTQPVVHTTLLSVEPNCPWSFITPPSSSKPVTRSAVPTRSSSAHKQPTVFVDVSSTTYIIFPSCKMPISLPPSPADLGLASSFIAEPPSTSHAMDASPSNLSVPSNRSSESETSSTIYPHKLSYIPRSAAILINVPSSSSATSISMLHTYILHTLPWPHPGTVPPDESSLHSDITRNYYELSVLAKTQLKLEVSPILPFHLAVVEAMHNALDRDWDRVEAVVDS